MNTPFVQLHFRLHLPGGKLVPYGLFQIRQHFPAAFRRSAGCCTDAGGCSAGPDCPCRTVFDQNLTPDPSALRRYQKPPLPFIFKIPCLPEKSREGGFVEISLVIAGDAIRYLDLFIKAVRLMFAVPERFQRWHVGMVTASAGDGTRTVIPEGKVGTEFASLPLLSFDELFSPGGIACSSLSIEFLTPLRLIHHGIPLREISFNAIAGALLRRISALVYYYGNEELPYDFKWLAAKSREISCRRSDVRWVNRGGVMQGIEGTAAFSGDLGEFVPFLTLGSSLNIGKGATYGLGSYRVIPE